jgi:hypothetical protein
MLPVDVRDHIYLVGQLLVSLQGPRIRHPQGQSSNSRTRPSSTFVDNGQWVDRTPLTSYGGLRSVLWSGSMSLRRILAQAYQERSSEPCRRRGRRAKIPSELDAPGAAPDSGLPGSQRGVLERAHAVGSVGGQKIAGWILVGHGANFGSVTRTT